MLEDVRRYLKLGEKTFSIEVLHSEATDLNSSLIVASKNIISYFLCDFFFPLKTHSN